MQTSHSFVAKTTADSAQRAPLHDDIAQCARDLWVERGQPADRDLEIWLEAEQRLLSATTHQVSRQKSADVAASRKLLAAKTGQT